MMKYSQKLEDIIRADEWMMACLTAVAQLNLSDWYIGAGFVRNKVWDVLHGFEQRTPLRDVDVVYFDRRNTCKDSTKAFEQCLLKIMPGINWSVLNLATIHLRYDQAEFDDSSHAISYWPEVSTCVGVRLEPNSNALSITAPFGLDDIFELLVKPNTAAGLKAHVYASRIAAKQWHKTWHKLLIKAQ